MQTEPAVSTFRDLVVKCLQQTKSQVSEPATIEPRPKQNPASDPFSAAELRTEINLRVIEDFLKP